MSDVLFINLMWMMACVFYFAVGYQFGYDRRWKLELRARGAPREE